MEFPEIVGQLDALFKSWLKTSEAILLKAETLRAKGHEIDGYDEFLRVVEEARATVENSEWEVQMPSLDELKAFVRTENPDPSRYE